MNRPSEICGGISNFRGATYFFISWQTKGTFKTRKVILANFGEEGPSSITVMLDREMRPGPPQNVFFIVINLQIENAGVPSNQSFSFSVFKNFRYKGPTGSF